MEGRQIAWDRIAIYALILILLSGACIGGILPALGINPENLVKGFMQPTTAPGQPTRVAAQPTTAPGQPSPVPGQPTVRPTVPANATGVPTALPKTTAAANNLPTVQFGVSPEFPAYNVALLVAAKTGLPRGVNAEVIVLENDEYACDWVWNKDPSDYYPTLSAEAKNDAKYKKSAPNVLRVLFTTQSSVFMCPDNFKAPKTSLRMPIVIGMSRGADALTAKDRIVDAQGRVLAVSETYDDMLNNTIVGTGFASTTEYLIKMLSLIFDRPVGQFVHADDPESAVNIWANGSDLTVGTWDPYTQDALNMTKFNPRVMVSTANIAAIIDVWGVKPDPSLNATEQRAILAYCDAFAQMHRDPEGTWLAIKEYVDANPDAYDALGKDSYNDYQAWWDGVGAEAMMSCEANYRLYATAKPILTTFVDLPKEVFGRPGNQTFKRNTGAQPIPPYSAKEIIDDSFLLALKNEPIVKEVVKVQNHDFQLTKFAPPSTGRKVLSKLPFLMPNSKMFKPDSPEFAASSDEIRAEFNSKIVRVLQFMRVNVQITASLDPTAQSRAERVRALLSSLGVPGDKVIVTGQNGPAGAVSFAIVGTEE